MERIKRCRRQRCRVLVFSFFFLFPSKAAALKAFPFNLCAPAEKLTKFTALNTCVLAAAATGAAPLGGWLSRGDPPGGYTLKSIAVGGFVKAANATFAALSPIFRLSTQFSPILCVCVCVCVCVPPCTSSFIAITTLNGPRKEVN